MASVKITFLGHASFKFESDKGTTIYFDPWLDDNPMAKIKLSQVRKADIVIATHGHMDHVGDSFEICRRTNAKFVGNYEMCQVAEAHGLEMENRALTMNPGGTVKVKDVSITMVQAHHSLSMAPHLVKGPPTGNDYFRPDSAVSGFVLAFDNGISIYDSSDTCLFGDMQLIGQMYGPQIAIFPVGGKYTMDIRQAARAASYVNPDVVIPCHYGETMGQPADIAALSQAVEFLSSNTKVQEMKVGQTLSYTASSYKLSGRGG